MALPTQTWIYPTLPTAVASAPSTSNVLAAIKSALDGWAAGTWESDVYSAGNYLKVRRKGSPGGTLGTFRGLFFGRRADQSPAAPAQDALAGNNGSYVDAASDTLYCGVGEDIGATSIVDPTTGNPYPTAKFTGGVKCGAGFSGHANYNVFLCACDTMLVVFLYNDAQISFCVIGEIIERASDGAGIWGVYASTNQGPSCDMTLAPASLLPAVTTYAVQGAYHNGGSQVRLERANAIGGTTQQPCFDSETSSGILLPVIMSKSDITNISTRSMFGTLRQIRMGPYDIGRKIIKDSGSTVQAIFMNAGSAVLGSGLYLDQNP